MSDPNIPHASTSPAPGYVPIDYTPPKPTSVVVLSIIGIVFGVLGLVCVPLGLASYFVPSMQAQNPGIAAVKANPPLFAWVLASNLFGLLLSVLLLLGSIGSLRLMKWARSLMIAYSVIGIAATIVISVVNLVWLTPVMFENVPPEVRGVVKVSSYVGAVLGILFGLAMPVLILVFFRKPHVVDAFERRITL